MSLKIRGFDTLESYWKWNSSVSKSDSSSGRVMSGRRLEGGASAAALTLTEALLLLFASALAAMEEKVRSARRSFSWLEEKFHSTATP